MLTILWFPRSAWEPKPLGALRHVVDLRQQDGFRLGAERPCSPFPRRAWERETFVNVPTAQVENFSSF